MSTPLNYKTMPSNPSPLEFDHLSLSNSDRELVRQAVGGASRVYLAPMDKGLSGSAVWQARWQLPDLNLSKLHVFKIGIFSKLKREEQAVLNVASVIDHFPLAYLYSCTSGDRALFRQEFSGDPNGKTFSLREYFSQPEFASTPTSVSLVVDRLFQEKMAAWHYNQRGSSKTYKSIDAAVPWLKPKVDLEGAASKIGKNELERELVECHGLSLEELYNGVENSFNKTISMRIGPVHGDLHATNINLDSDLNIHLIDFAFCCYSWRAIDFLMLESALKFIVAPAHAPLQSFINSETYMDLPSSVKVEESVDLYGAELSKIVSAVSRVRYHCNYSEAEVSMANYRIGLICVAAAFSSLDKWVNHRFLFHSIAFHLKKLRD